MSGTAQPRYFWFKASITLGVLLGLLLLGQTISTYIYVSDSLVRQQAQSEADRKFQSLVRVARAGNNRDAATLGPVAAELIKETPDKLAWIRVMNADGKVLSSAGKVDQAAAWTQTTLRDSMSGPGRGSAIRKTEKGDVLVSLRRMDFGRGFFSGPPGGSGQQGRGPDGPGGPNAAAQSALVARFSEPGQDRGGDQGGFGGRGDPGPSGDFGRGRGGRQGGNVVETAIFMDGVSIDLKPILQNLIVGVSAATALLAAMLIIGLRFRHYLSARHMEEELSLARRVQTDLFPTDAALSASIEYAARCVPAAQVGGDLYDVFETDDGGGALVLGDVSGKGLSAALLMGVVQGAVRASSGSGSAIDHELAAERLNHLLCMKTARERFVSLFWCFFDSRKGRLAYINCGHLPPLLVRRKHGKMEVLRLLEGGGPVLGVLPGARFTQAQTTIESGDVLVVFSDGILEATNAAGEEFEEERIVEAIKTAGDTSTRDICEAILSGVRTFLGRELPHDDQTLMVVRLERVTMDQKHPSQQERFVPSAV